MWQIGPHFTFWNHILLGIMNQLKKLIFVLLLFVTILDVWENWRKKSAVSQHSDHQDCLITYWEQKNNFALHATLFQIKNGCRILDPHYFRQNGPPEWADYFRAKKNGSHLGFHAKWTSSMNQWFYRYSYHLDCLVCICDNLFDLN